MTSSSLVHPKYRRDIDGLRAVAVLSVVAFHAFPDWMRGGFIGVDIFFVISGYLISTIIFQSLNQNTFSFSEFYMRRARRIFPALLLVLVASYAFGWFALFASEFKQLSKHIVGGAAFVSNLVLWAESGYFDNSAATKPLLHLWSLGVEEQFYLAWPFMVWFSYKRRFNILVFGSLVALASFLLNLAEVKSDTVAAFYAPQTRFWELVAGSMLAWWMLRSPHYADTWGGKSAGLPAMFKARGENSTERLANGCSALGLLVLVYGFLNIDKDVGFPGVWALVPVVGSVLVILSGPGAWVNRVLLSSKPMVWFGLISFPLYLWHWPVFSFANIVFHETPAPSLMACLMLISVTLAWLTYELLERPIRFGRFSQQKVSGLWAAMAVVLATGLITYSGNGFASRPAVKHLDDNVVQLNWASEKSKGCEARLGASAMFCMEFGNGDNATVAVLGDSTANSLSPGLYEVIYADRKEGLFNFGVGTCPPIRGMVANSNWGAANSPLAPNCVEVTDRSYSYVLNNPKIKTVVLVIFARDLQNWGVGDLRPGDLSGRFGRVKSLLDRDIDDLQRSGKQVVVSYDMPLYPIDAHSCISRPFNAYKGGCSVPENELKDREPFLSLFKSYFENKSKVCVVQSSKALIVNHNASLLDKDGVLLLRDNHHLSYHGSRVVAKEFKNQHCIV